MRSIVWEVECLSPPNVIKYCKRCKVKKNYQSSGLFRINAQRKSLDIWLIYKCEDCCSTWNAEIFSRVSPQKISSGQLERFHQNDRQLAENYAMNLEWLRSNQVEFSLPEYEVTGSRPPFSADTRICIKNPFHIPLKVSAVIQRHLSISQNQLVSMFKLGQIVSEDGKDLRKMKLSEETEVVC